jgi:DNA-binding NarL/FixJ family response regulator
MIFDLAMLEVGPAGAPGERTIAAVKARQPGISIVAMSDSADPELQTRIRGTGIIYYMLIPSEIHHLKLILDHLSARTLPAAALPPQHRKASAAWESPV